MKITDSALLAYTKFRARKIRTIITAIIAGLVFGILVFGSLVISGLGNSLGWYGQKGYGGMYLVSVSQLIDYEKLHVRSEEIYRQKMDQGRAEAKRKGVDFDESNASSKYFPEAEAQARSELVKPVTEQDVVKLAQGYGGSSVYKIKQSSGESTSLILDGKEKALGGGGGGNPFDGSTDALVNLSISAIDKDLMKPFVVKGSLGVEGDGRVPLLLPMDAAMQLKKAKIPANAKPEDVFKQKRQLRSSLLGSSLPMCYRNSTAAALLEEAKEQQKLFDRNKNNKDFTKPSLVYKISDSACQPVGVAEDKRSTEEKAAAEKLKKDQKQPEPKTELVTYVIRGFVPGQPDFRTGAGLLAGIFQTGPIGQTIIPLDVALAHPVLGQYFNPGGPVQTTAAKGRPSSPGDVTADTVSYFINLPSRAEQKKFLESQCKVSEQYGGIEKCIKDGRLFAATPYGNPRVALEDFVAGFLRFARYVLIVAVILAGLLMMSAISRVIADSRRETGVFRALGAKRRDIVQIYLTYALYLASLSFVIATALALVAAFLLARAQANYLTVGAADLFAAYENPRTVWLVGIDPQQLLVIGAIALAAGLLGAIIPVTANVRRNPINDMRDE